MPNWKYPVFVGNCVNLMRKCPANSVDAIVTDPPYGLKFMGKEFDNLGEGVQQRQWHAAWAKEALRVLKPGGHIIAFGGTRTYHHLASALEEVGFEIRDCISWVHSQGFPKSHNLKDQWEGWGTNLKPAVEPAVLARKPLVGTVAANVLEWGTGAINVDGCRVATDDKFGGGAKATSGFVVGYEHDGWTAGSPQGRWPANLIHDGSDDVVGLFPADVKGGVWNSTSGARHFNNNGESTGYQTKAADTSSGSAARFFYCAKANKQERGAGNNHPTVKPVELMKYCIRLILPPGGIVLDPFVGSGTTLIAAKNLGVKAIGMELDPEYAEIAKKRIGEAR